MGQIDSWNRGFIYMSRVRQVLTLISWIITARYIGLMVFYERLVRFSFPFESWVIQTDQ